MKRPSWNDLNALAEIVARRSFRQAADVLGVTRSSLSHAMRHLERDLGVRLLHRTTRSVAPTPEAERLLARLMPLLRDMDDALAEVAPSDGQVRGTLRINGNEPGIRLLFATVVPAFMARYPQVELDLVSEGALVDIVAQGFDAGIRLAASLEGDMIAVPLGPPVRFLAVASPGYLSLHPGPQVPGDLLVHRCIRQRLPSGKRYRWEFTVKGETASVDVPGTLTLDSSTLMVEAAIDSLGIAYVPEHYARTALDDGRLRTVLEALCPPEPGLCLYYPGHRQPPATLRAFIDMLRDAAYAG